MKRILWCLIVFLGIGGLAMAQDNGGYYMGPGMMWEMVMMIMAVIIAEMRCMVIGITMTGIGIHKVHLI